MKYWTFYMKQCSNCCYKKLQGVFSLLKYTLQVPTFVYCSVNISITGRKSSTLQTCIETYVTWWEKLFRNQFSSPKVLNFDIISGCNHFPHFLSFVKIQEFDISCKIFKHISIYLEIFEAIIFDLWEMISWSFNLFILHILQDWLFRSLHNTN